MYKIMSVMCTSPLRTILTESVIRMREEESIQRQEEEEDEVRDEVEKEDGSPVCPPFVLQQTGHHWVFEEVITFVLHLQHDGDNHKMRETHMREIALIPMTCSRCIDPSAHGCFSKMEGKYIE